MPLLQTDVVAQQLVDPVRALNYPSYGLLYLLHFFRPE